MVDDLALKQTTERLGGNTATAEKFLAGTKGDRLREAAKGSLQGRPEYEHLFPQFPGTSAFLSKMGI